MATIIFENGTDGLFDLLNQVFALQSSDDSYATLNRSVFDTLIATIGPELSTATWTAAINKATAGIEKRETAIPDMISGLKAMATEILINSVDTAVSLPSRTLAAALDELSRQMVSESESLQTPAVSATVTAGAGNSGDGVLICTVKQDDGTPNPFVFAETVGIVSKLQSFSVRLVADSDASNTPLSASGLGGSGLSAFAVSYFSITSGITSAISVYSFTTSASVLPGIWLANVGTLGTSVKSGQPQTDTITISGTPTAGTYRIQCATSGGGTQSTSALDFDATESEVLAAVRSMPGYSSATVTTTGTSPNFVHTIKFFGMKEAVTTSVVNSTTSGTFTVATPTAYSSPSIGSSPLVLISDGSTLLSVSHLLRSLTPRTVYAVNAWLALNTASASGVIEFALTSGIGGSILQDDAGNDLKYTVNASDLTTAYKSSAKLAASGSPFFILPKTIPESVYLRIRSSTTLVSTRQLYIENIVFGQATQLYTGGPYVAVFSGPLGIQVGDSWSVAVANNYAGFTSKWMERNFELRSLGVKLPHSGSPTITDGTAYTVSNP